MSITQTNDPINTEMRFTDSGWIGLPMEIRERFLTPALESGSCQVQLVGTELRITIFSNNQNIQIHIPTTEWTAGPPRKREINDWRIFAKRWEGMIKSYRDAKGDRFVPVTISFLDQVEGVPEELANG